jgi:hypothetical protein
LIDNVATYVIVFYTNKYLSFCSLLPNQFGMYYWQTIVFQLFSEQLTGLETIQQDWTTESTTINCHWKSMEPTFFLKSVIASKQEKHNSLETRFSTSVFRASIFYISRHCTYIVYVGYISRQCMYIALTRQIRVIKLMLKLSLKWQQHWTSWFDFILCVYSTVRVSMHCLIYIGIPYTLNRPRKQKVTHKRENSNKTVVC